MGVLQRLGPLIPGSRLRPHLALPAPRTAGVTIPHPHAREGVVGDLPLVPDAEDPAVGVPAEGLLVLGHVVEWAELVLVRGLHQAEALARESEEMRRPWKRLTLIPRLRAQNLFAKTGRVCFQRTSF